MVDAKLFVEVGPSAIHGHGLFAREAIAGGIRVIRYVGEQIGKAESRRRQEAGNECLFYLDENWDLDGRVEENLARWINHSCGPNCEVVRADGAIWIVSMAPIAEGQEITFNYGYDLEDYRDHPCHCGSAECIGYMVAEEFFGQLRRMQV